MRIFQCCCLSIFLALHATSVFSQEAELSKSPTLALTTGLINYQGDLNPSSFTLGRSKLAIGLTFRQPLSPRLAIRSGILIGQLEAADRYNRTYLQPRNLSFQTSLQEAHVGLELNFFKISSSRFTPYIYGGLAVFHFDPWAYDNSGNKTFLKPLSTEGQGLAEFPGQKPYRLTQLALPFGVGVKYRASDNVTVGLEFSQRKTFTDYLDDVSSHYVDRQTLLTAKGSKAVEMAYRGLPAANASAAYPASGEQRGTPSEMDWYYFTGLHLEIRLGAIGGLLGRPAGTAKYVACPRNVHAAY